MSARHVLVRAQLLLAVCAPGAARAAECAGEGYRAVVIEAADFGELLVAVGPLDAPGQDCLARAVSALSAESRFEGALPIGEYRYGEQVVRIPEGASPLQVYLVERRDDEAPTCGPCCHGGGPDCDEHERDEGTDRLRTPAERRRERRYERRHERRRVRE